MIRPTVARVDLAAIESNFSAISTFLSRSPIPDPGSPTTDLSPPPSDLPPPTRPPASGLRPPRVIAVVKANAYGHGASEVGLALERAGAAMLACADIEEGIVLRRAGVRIPILVFGALGISDLQGVFEFELTPTISTPSAAHALEAAAAKYIENPVASAFRRKIFWTATPIAAAAVIILAMLPSWRSPATPAMRPGSPAMARVEPQPVVRPPAAPKTAEAGTRTGTVLRSSPPAERQPPSRAMDDRIIVAAVGLDDNATEIDPLAPIAPIVAAGTHPPDIAPKEIPISQMAPIAQLQIAPLSPPERRN